MAGELVISIICGLAACTLAYSLGAGVGGGILAYSVGGTMWLMSGLLADPDSLG